MKKYRESVILYIKIFLVLLVIGILVPNIIALALNHLIIKPDIEPPDNYIYVMSHLKKANPFMRYFLKLWEK